MKFTSKDKVIFIILIVFVNIALRFPILPNEIGWDSFVVHSLSNSLSSLGIPKWWLNPLSIIGSYPYSIGSAVPFFLSGISQLLGITMDKSIFLYSILISIVSILVTYVLAYKIFDNDLISIAAALCFTTSPAVLSFSTWTCSTRTLFILFILPLFLYSLINIKDNRKFYIMTILSALLGLSTHHYTFFLFPLIIAYVVIHLLYKYDGEKYLNDYRINIIYFICLIILFLVPFFTGIFMTGERGYAGSRYAFVLVIIQSFIRYTGILLILAIGGFAYLLAKRKKSLREWFLLLSISFITPLMYIETYMKWFSQTFVFILVSISLNNIIKTKYIKMFVLFIVLSISISAYLQFIYKNEDESRYLDMKSYHSGNWIASNVDGNLIGTSAYPTLRIFAISNVPTLTISNMLNYVNGFIEYNESSVVKKYDASSLNYYSDGPYDIEATDGEWYVRSLSDWQVHDMHYNDLISKFNLSYFIHDASYNTIFSTSLYQSDKNIIYSNGRISIWDIQN